MTRIGLLSDTHGYLDESVFTHFDRCDEIWHAGDFGHIAVADTLAAFKPLKGVYGNIDGQDIRSAYPEHLRFACEAVDRSEEQRSELQSLMRISLAVF